MAGRPDPISPVGPLALRLQRLAKLPVAIRAQVLASALPLADSHDRHALGAALAQACMLPRQSPSHVARSGRLRSFLQSLRPASRVDGAQIALRELALAWKWLPDDVREIARLAGQGRWQDVAIVPDLLGPDALESLALCAAKCPSAAFAQFAVLAATSTEPSARRAGERAMLGLALWSAHEPFPHEGLEGLMPLGAPPKEECSPQETKLVVAGLRTAIDGFAQQRPRGLVLAVIGGCSAPTLRAHPDLAALLASDDPRAGVILGALRSTPWSLARTRAWEWARLASFQRGSRLTHALRARLSQALSTDEHEAVLAKAHLALSPLRAELLKGVIVRGIRRQLRGVNAASRMSGVRIPAKSALPQPAAMRALSIRAKRELPRWARRIRADVATQIAACEPLLVDAYPGVRMALARHAPSALLPDLMHDSCASVATLAHVRWVDEQADRGTHLAIERGGAASLAARHASLVHARSTHAMVRELAAASESGGDTWCSCPAGRLGLWRWLRDDREGLLVFLRLAIEQGAEPDAIMAFQTARRLGVADELSSSALSMLSLTSSSREALAPSHRVVATAASFLGSCTGPESHAALLRASAHIDARVRANAIDALVFHRVRHPDVLIELKPLLLSHVGDASLHHRVRGSSVRAMLLLGDPQAAHAGATSLSEMLGDDRATHRLAGVWVVGRVRSWMHADSNDWLGLRAGAASWFSHWPALRARVEEIALRDRDDTIRRRAAGCVHRLHAIPDMAHESHPRGRTSA
jgi:hypothetical protein